MERGHGAGALGALVIVVGIATPAFASATRAPASARADASPATPREASTVASWATGRQMTTATATLDATTTDPSDAAANRDATTTDATTTAKPSPTSTPSASTSADAPYAEPVLDRAGSAWAAFGAGAAVNVAALVAITTLCVVAFPAGYALGATGFVLALAGAGAVFVVAPFATAAAIGIVGDALGDDRGWAWPMVFVVAGNVVTLAAGVGATLATYQAAGGFFWTAAAPAVLVGGLVLVGGTVASAGVGAYVWSQGAAEYGGWDE